MENIKTMRWEEAPDLLKPQEAALLLRIGKNKIYEIANLKGFPKLYLGEKHFIVPKDLLQKWVESRIKAS